VTTARNSFWLVAEKTLRLLSALVVATWVARHLGPSEFGRFSYALALVAMFTPLASMGLDSVLVRALVRTPQARSALIGTAMLLRGIGAVLTVACSLVAASVILSSTAGLPEIVLPLALATLCVFADPMDAVMQATMRNHVSVAIRSGSLIVASGLRIGLILCGAGVVAFAWVQAAEAAMACLGLIWLLRRSDMRPIPSWAATKELLTLAWPLAVTGLLIGIYTKLDQIFLGYFVSHEDLGVYAAAMRISELWYFLPSAVIVAVFPTMVRLHANSSPQAFQIHFQRLLDLASFSAMVICSVISAASGLLTGILYGQSFAGSAGLLAILAWNGYFITLGIAVGSYYTVTGRTGFVMASALAGAVLGIGLNLLLIPRIGASGAAVASVAAQAGGMLLPLLFFSGTRDLRLPILRSLFPFLRLHEHVRWLLGTRLRAG